MNRTREGKPVEWARKVLSMWGFSIMGALMEKEMKKMYRVNYTKKDIRGYRDYKHKTSALKFAKKVLDAKGNVYIEVLK